MILSMRYSKSQNNKQVKIIDEKLVFTKNAIIINEMSNILRRSMNTMSRNLDVIIFGASGFTGKHTVLEGVKILANYKWGIAGRNEEKLMQILSEVSAKSETDLSQIPIVIADYHDNDSIRNMVSKCKVLVNCCGPYRFFGEKLVQSCIEQGTHHVDVSGEPQYLEKMQLKYFEKAKEKSVYVVTACGFDSIPADLGTIFLEGKFDGIVNSVETFIEPKQERGVDHSGGIHFGTWESAIYAVANTREVTEIRQKLFSNVIPPCVPKLKERSLIHQNPIVNNRWCLPFLGSDRSCVYRSQRFFFENEHKRPIQMKAYISFDGFPHVIGVIFVGAIFSLLCRSTFGRKLLLKHPRLFSLGMVSHKGPTEESMKNTKFVMHFYGEGWNNGEDTTKNPTKAMVTRISGANPGYGATCVSLLLSAKTILNESEKLPDKGGVFTPGIAFAKTNLINELCNHGFTFEAEEPKPLK